MVDPVRSCTAFRLAAKASATCSAEPTTHNKHISYHASQYWNFTSSFTYLLFFSQRYWGRIRSSYTCYPRRRRFFLARFWKGAIKDDISIGVHTISWLSFAVLLRYLRNSSEEFVESYPFPGCLSCFERDTHHTQLVWEISSINTSIRKQSERMRGHAHILLFLKDDILYFLRILCCYFLSFNECFDRFSFVLWICIDLELHACWN